MTESRPSPWRRRLLVLGLLLGAIAVLAHALVARVDERLNRTDLTGMSEPSESSLSLHQRVFPIDLHADALLWNRDLSQRNERGHVDLPRLREGGMGLQVFSIVTMAPRSPSYGRNEREDDTIGLLMAAQLRAPSTWTSPLARALAQAADLRALAERDSGFEIVLTEADLDALVARRAQDSSALGGLLALEGAYAVEGGLEHLEDVHAAGIRMISPAHFFDSELGGSAHGESGGALGLTTYGEAVFARAEELGVVVDLSHASSALISEWLAKASQPVVFSHTGVRGTHESPRNLSDAQLRALARNGGVVGIGYWKGATGGSDVDSIVRAIRHAVAVAGLKHVGLGSDWDGTVTTPFDAAGLPRLTQALVAAGFTAAEVEAILGGNAVRVLKECLR